MLLLLLLSAWCATAYLYEAHAVDAPPDLDLGVLLYAAPREDPVEQVEVQAQVEGGGEQPERGMHGLVGHVAEAEEQLVHGPLCPEADLQGMTQARTGQTNNGVMDQGRER